MSKIGANAHQLPADENLKEIVRQQQIEHRKAKQRQVKEEPSKPPAAVQMPFCRVNVMIGDVLLQFVSHVAHRKDVDQGGDERHHHKHQGREHVDAEAQIQQRSGLMVAQVIELFSSSRSSSLLDFLIGVNLCSCVGQSFCEARAISDSTNRDLVGGGIDSSPSASCRPNDPFSSARLSSSFLIRLLKPVDFLLDLLKACLLLG